MAAWSLRAGLTIGFVSAIPDVGQYANRGFRIDIMLRVVIV